MFGKGGAEVRGCRVTFSVRRMGIGRPLVRSLLVAGVDTLGWSGQSSIEIHHLNRKIIT